MIQIHSIPSKFCFCEESPQPSPLAKKWGKWHAQQCHYANETSSHYGLSSAFNQSLQQRKLFLNHPIQPKFTSKLEFQFTISDDLTFCQGPQSVNIFSASQERFLNNRLFTLMVVLVDPSSTKEEWTRTVIQCFPRALLESQAIFQTVCEIRTRCYSK